jgi:amino acid adenylation domain-containing protein
VPTEELPVEEIRRHLQAVLPEYMVPGAYVVLESLPLTPNGKVDRQALPAPDLEAYGVKEYEPPQGEIEEILAGIWQELLQVERVGRQDNFFELGGHSLLAVQVITRVRQALGHDLTLRDLFDVATFSQLIGRIDQMRQQQHVVARPPLIPKIRPKEIPLSYAQERLWFLEQLGLAGVAYNVSIALRLDGALDARALERSFSELISRHESLRTRFQAIDGRPIQLIDAPAEYRLELIDLSVLRPEELESRARRLAQQEALHRFDLSKGSLFRAVVLRIGEQAHLLCITMHHIVSDGWSMGVLTRELSALYEAHVSRLSPKLEPLSVQYADYAIWQREWLQGEELLKQLRYWKEQLSELTTLQLPIDRPRPAVASFRGASSEFILPPQLCAALIELSRRENATLFMLLLAAFQALLSRWSGQQDIVVGSPIAGRSHRQIEGLIGFFVNTLALRTRVDDELSFRELLLKVKGTALEAYAHHDLPFEKLVAELQPERDLAKQPLFQVSFQLVRFPREELARTGLRLSAASATVNTTSKFDLSLEMVETAAGLRGRFEYATDLFDHTTIERLQECFGRLLAGIVADPNARMSRVPLLSERELQQVTVGFNATQQEYPQDQLIHELFEAQVRRTPQVIAVVYEGRQLTYAELNAQANQLARYLRSVGVGADKLVALCVERSVEMVVGILGILKAGGAYVPLDPSYPRERLEYLLQDAAPKVVLIQEELRERLPATDARLISLDSEWSEIAGLGTSDLSARELGLTPRHLAYVIYTSGSTGQPKGVMVEHRGLLNYLQWAMRTYAPEAGAGSVVSSSYAFDATVTALYTPLLCGRSVVLLREGDELEGLEAQLRGAQTWSLVKITPAHLQLLGQRWQGAPGECSVGAFVIGGEALLPSTVELWRSIAPRVRLINEYGPTETVVGCSIYEVPAGWGGESSVPIGRPIANTRMYVLDAHRQPVPIGVAGEIYIGGAGVARGYLNRDALTAERFVVDPFSADPPARLYKTGDVGRWRADGNLEYLGRNDHQVKIRGYRIELGEIESQLSRHKQVKEAVVLAREGATYTSHGGGREAGPWTDREHAGRAQGDESGEKRLVAYVVSPSEHLKSLHANDSATAAAELVHEWQELYENTYAPTGTHPGPSFVGWNSSYTGLSIPDSHMREWLDCTIARIRALGPRRVLEIGCGVGLLVQQLAPYCEAYQATDFSSAAIGALTQWMAGRQELAHVELSRRAATELDSFAPRSVDTIILNSVVQYFPDVDYLFCVLERATALVSPGGHIFIGDVRNLSLLETFHASVQVAQAARGVTVEQLNARVRRAISQDKELVLAPEFFRILLERLPQISHVEVRLKEGRSDNELTRYRYDVILHVGESDCHAMQETECWYDGQQSTAALADCLRVQRPVVVRFRGVPNRRLSKDVHALQWLRSTAGSRAVHLLQDELIEAQSVGEDPESFATLGDLYGYAVTVDWSTGSTRGDFDVSFVDHTRAGDARLRVHRAPMPQASAWDSCANDPLAASLRRQLVVELRKALQARLPEYMVPAAFVVLDSLPLTPNGKVDRKRLPAPELEGYGHSRYEAPQGEIEETVAEIWRELLQVDRVGRQDNFFELGGHSLLAMQIVARIGSATRVDLSVRALFDAPTVMELGRRIHEFRVSAITAVLESTDDTQDALLDRIAAMSDDEVDSMMQVIENVERRL